MEINQLITEIDTCFPSIEKPKEKDIFRPSRGNQDFEEFKEYFIQFQNDEIPSEAIESIYQDMVYLTATAWRWVLPTYLKHCLAKSTKPYVSYAHYLGKNPETEFLLYNLSPSEEFENDAMQRLGEFNESQLRCIINFLEWCRQYPHLQSFRDKEIPNCIKFINKCIQSLNLTVHP